jgi:hypothetical protein
MNEVEKKVAEIDGMIQQKRDELQELYRKANTLFEMFDIQHERYDIKDEDKVATISKLQGHEYRKKPLATAITLILEDREKRNMGPATSDEILAKLTEGGYEFEVRDSKIALGTALAKNPKFAKLTNGKWILEDHPKEGRRGRPKGTVATPPRSNEPQKNETPETDTDEKLQTDDKNEEANS